MKETTEDVVDAEMVGVIADLENRKSKWVKADEVQKREHETMDVEITGLATKKTEAYMGDATKMITSIEVPVKDVDGEPRTVTLTGRNILRVVKGDGKYQGLGSNRKAWVGQKLRLKAVASDKAKSGYSLQVFPLLLFGGVARKAGGKSPAQSDELEAYL